MLEHEFNTEIARLKLAYSEKAFNSERSALLWRRFHSADIETFRNAVDHMILNNRQPPLVNDFGNAVGKVREKTRDHQKSFERASGQSLLAQASMPLGELGDGLDMIRQRLSGKMPDKEWNDFMIVVKKKYSPDHIWDSAKGEMVPNAEAPPEYRWLVEGRNPAK